MSWVYLNVWVFVYDAIHQLTHQLPVLIIPYVLLYACNQLSTNILLQLYLKLVLSFLLMLYDVIHYFVVLISYGYAINIPYFLYLLQYHTPYLSTTPTLLY